MRKIDHRWAQPLHSVDLTRRLERAAQASLPPNTLMQRAGLAVAQLARALAPHARTIWIACGPGNNGGDGLEAAMHLHRQGLNVAVTWLGDPEELATGGYHTHLRRGGIIQLICTATHTWWRWVIQKNSVSLHQSGSVVLAWYCACESGSSTCLNSRCLGNEHASL